MIIPSDRFKSQYGFCESVNVHGTRHVLDAARKSGADVFVSTTSGSISIRPVKLWMAPWKIWTSWPAHYWQTLDESDFFQPLRKHEEFYANYPAAKASAERIVCEANSPSLRTGSIRPANGVYGNPTDNTVGGPLNMSVYPTYVPRLPASTPQRVRLTVHKVDKSYCPKFCPWNKCSDSTSPAGGCVGLPGLLNCSSGRPTICYHGSERPYYLW